MNFSINYVAYWLFICYCFLWQINLIGHNGKHGVSTLLVLLNRNAMEIWMRFHKGFDYIVQSKVLGKYYMTCQKLIQTMHILTQWSSCPFHFYILSKSVLSWNNTMPIVKNYVSLQKKKLQRCGQLKQHK